MQDKTKFHYAIQLATGSRVGLRPAGKLNSIMEFGLLGAIQFASRSQTNSRAGHRPAANRSATRFELSRYVKIARTCVGNQVCNQLNQICDQLSSWSQTC